MIFSYNWLQSFFKKQLPGPEKLAELLTLHSFEVKEVKRAGSDFVLDIDVLPNRGPDCFSHLGVAREISAILNYKLQIPNYKPKEDRKLKTKDFLSVEVKPRQACLRYTAKVITNVKVGPSPKWLKDKLEVCGLQSINNIVDIANFVMLETGQPLHAFDLEKLESANSKKKIIVRFAKGRERIVTLDEKTFELNPEILVIADAKRPVAIAGIKGGIMPKIDEKTKIVVLESANFNPGVIRRASQKLNLKTDASLRFEHGIDPNLTEFAINRASFLTQKIANGKVAKGLVDFYSKKVLPKQIKLDLDYTKRLLGLEIPRKEIKSILESLGLKVTETRSLTNKILVEVPTFRLDINLPEDLIEEIGRIYGFQRIPSHPPLVSLIPPERNLNIFWEDFVKDVLKEAGFSEVYNYSFISEKMAKIFGYQPKDLIEIENPVSSEQKFLRPSLILNLLKNVKDNKKKFEEIKIFELGKIFQKDSVEKKALTGLMVRLRSPSTLSLSNGLIFKKESKETFFELKGVSDLLLNKMGISQIFYDEYEATPDESKISIWHPKKCAEIKVDHQEIGFLGEISPKILDNLGISSQEKIVVFDFDFEKLQKLASEEHEFRPLSKYPSAVRDLAILVPPETRVEEILSKIEIAGGSLVRDVDLFDIYEGEELPEGKKNLAFHIIYQAEDRTLSSKEIDGMQEKIIEALEEEPEWQVRR
jgi:phenylalanyl-tRNA synthetase beta chain